MRATPEVHRPDTPLPYTTRCGSARVKRRRDRFVTWGVNAPRKKAGRAGDRPFCAVRACGQKDEEVRLPELSSRSAGHSLCACSAVRLSVTLLLSTDWIHEQGT